MVSVASSGSWESLVAVCCRKFFWDPDRFGHWGFWIKCISRCWELTLRNGDRVGVGAEGILRKEESRMFHQDLLNLLGLGAESEESHNRSSAAELGMGLC